MTLEGEDGGRGGGGGSGIGGGVWIPWKVDPFVEGIRGDIGGGRGSGGQLHGEVVNGRFVVMVGSVFAVVDGC